MKISDRVMLVHHGDPDAWGQRERTMILYENEEEAVKELHRLEAELNKKHGWDGYDWLDERRRPTLKYGANAILSRRPRPEEAEIDGFGFILGGPAPLTMTQIANVRAALRSHSGGSEGPLTLWDLRIPHQFTDYLDDEFWTIEQFSES